MAANPSLAGTYRMALLWWPLLTLALLPFGWRYGAGVAIGGGLSLGAIAYFEHMMQSLARAGRMRRARLYLLLALRYPVLVGLLFALARWRLAELAGLCLGVGLVPLAATMQVVRQYRRGEADGGSSPAPGRLESE